MRLRTRSLLHRSSSGEKSFGSRARSVTDCKGSLHPLGTTGLDVRSVSRQSRVRSRSVDCTGRGSKDGCTRHSLRPQVGESYTVLRPEIPGSPSTGRYRLKHVLCAVWLSRRKSNYLTKEEGVDLNTHTKSLTLTKRKSKRKKSTCRLTLPLWTRSSTKYTT